MGADMDSSAALSERESRDRELFDRIASTYAKKDLKPAHRIARKLRLTQTLKVADFGPAPRVMEIGCGAGFAARYMEGRYGAFVGIDYSEKLISYAREFNRNERATFEVVNINDYEPPEQFDVVFMIGLLHHLDDPAETLTKVLKHLRPGGWVVANEPQSGNPLVSWLRQMRKKVDKNYSDEQLEYARGDLRAIFEKAGLTDIKIVPQGILSTPFAEVSMPAQPLMAPISYICCALDRVLESALSPILYSVAWNLVAAGRRPA